MASCRAWLVDARAFARKVTGATKSTSNAIKDCGPTRECPNCHYFIDNSDVSYEWPGLPAGVKFEPSDAELIQHLAAKCGVGDLQPHLFLNEFIPTLDGDLGINYTHPENLPGAKRDGNSVHFFHRTANAYASGQRKRRKIDCQSSTNNEHFRWHKTGKTKPVMVNGVHKGWKKIMVLYTSSKKDKPNKSNWVMHQLHLGTQEDEKEGEYVVSKILYQQPKSDKTEYSSITEYLDKNGPKTPNPNPSNPPRQGNLLVSDDLADNYEVQSSALEAELTCDVTEPAVQFGDEIGYPEWLAGESQAPESLDFLDFTDGSLMCRENIDSSVLSNAPGHDQIPCTGLGCNPNEVTGSRTMSNSISELVNIEMDTPPDFDLANLQFGSEDSAFEVIDQY